MEPRLQSDLKPLFDEKCAVISDWMAAGKIARMDPRHLIFSIWSTTQHYADFAPQVALLLDNDADQHQQASDHLRLMFSTLLTPAAPQQ